MHLQLTLCRLITLISSSCLLASNSGVKQIVKVLGPLVFLLLMCFLFC